MFKLTVYILISMLLSLHSLASEKSEKPTGLLSSEIDIPERREYPVNNKLSPCDDFYQYSCSEVIKDFDMPIDRSRWTFSFIDSRERLLRVKKQHLSQAADLSKSSTKRSQQYLNYYMSCADTASRAKDEVAYVQQLQQTFNQLLNSKDPKRALLELLGENITRGNLNIIEIYSPYNQKDSNIIDFLFIAKLRNLPERSYYNDSNVMSDYLALISKLFESINLSNPTERAKKVIEFEKAYAQVYPTNAEFRTLRTREDKGLSKDQVLQEYPNFKLDKALSQVPNNTLIRNYTPDLSPYLNEKLEQLSFEELWDILLVSTLFTRLEEGYPEYFKQHYAFNVKHLGKSKQRPPVEERCTTSIIYSFAPEIDIDLYESVFPDFPEDHFRKLVERVRKTMKDKLAANKWLTTNSRSLAIEKLEAINLQVVKPREQKNWNFLPLREYSRSSYIQNQITLENALIQQQLNKLGKVADKAKWGMGPLTVNAYYSTPESKFVMPVGILQYPFYDVNGSDIENLGSIGVIVGHEVGHAFDDKGSMFDKNGNINPWMADEDLVSFANISRKLDMQYIAACKSAIDNLETLTEADNSEVPSKEELKKFCDGTLENSQPYAELTRGENIGDIAGLQFAYATAFPNNKASAQQQKKFFLQYGRVWCAKINRGQYLTLLKTDPHAQVPMRTNEPVKHLDGFHEAFSCKKGDKMFLPKEQRLNIW